MALDSESARRRSELLRRRQGISYEVDQGELASASNNPWQDRNDLLTEAQTEIDAEIAALENQPGLPGPALPVVPITTIQIETGPPASVRFDIGGEHFSYAEELDWAERGHQLAQAELRHESGNPSALLPSNLTPQRREALRLHLADSLFVFATNLRDRALAGDPPPPAPTLFDLAPPCPTCGGWMDWLKRCPSCAKRDSATARLREEADRLSRERDHETGARHRWLERLPIARRRLAEIDASLAALDASHD
ncbi:MAG: hypothetical protein H0T49_08095 [Chloroflexia bacterium]|nr:hypothetical protein [Chloroflexia bacterium]